MVQFGLSVMPEPCFAAAALPLFADDLIDAVEWSFDLGWGPSGCPAWLDQLLDDFAGSGDLVGHGVSFSLLSGEERLHERWLDRLRQEVAQRSYRHISEHIGFVGSGRFSFAAPLPMPYCESVVQLGQRRVAQLADAARCPVGLENLATSLSVEDGKQQGRLIEDLLAPTNGFVVLDLHNLWSQVTNLNLDGEAVLDTYPLERVREIHISGGTWDERSNRHVRRDTHDDVVPEPVYALLANVAPRCPQLELVIYERLGPTLADPATHGPFQADVRRAQEHVAAMQ